MKREPLSIGSTVQAKSGSSYTYIIDRVIGDGASSIVYEAHYIDNAFGRHDVRIKECYPYASDIQRVGTDLIWADIATATNDKVAFTTAYHKLLDFQNTTKLRNSTAHIFDLCEANGTLYSVMDMNEGQPFEQDNSEKLSDILKTTLALARVVEKYHNNGYLHLDIKPSNFLVISETRELVILFDVDSVTSMEDIASGKVKCVSYSKGWAAPEQMQGRIDKLCPATDIYSVGAILFQKVMGRTVENEDIGIFADWEFDGEIFDRVNPKIKPLLRDVFRKTLAANINRRHQTIWRLIVQLETLIEVVTSDVPFLMSNVVSKGSARIISSKKIQEIHTDLKQKGRCFVKSTSKQNNSKRVDRYIEFFHQEYDVIVSIDCNNGFEEMFQDIPIANLHINESKSEFKKALQIINALEVCNDCRVLLVIRNFNADIIADQAYGKEINRICLKLMFLNISILTEGTFDCSDYDSDQYVCLHNLLYEIAEEFEIRDNFEMAMQYINLAQKYAKSIKEDAPWEEECRKYIESFTSVLDVRTKLLAMDKKLSEEIRVNQAFSYPELEEDIEFFKDFYDDLSEDTES